MIFCATQCQAGRWESYFEFRVLFLSTIGFFFYFDMGVMAGALAVWFLFGGNSMLYAGPVGGN